MGFWLRVYPRKPEPEVEVFGGFCGLRAGRRGRAPTAAKENFGAGRHRGRRVLGFRVQGLGFRV